MKIKSIILAVVLFMSISINAQTDEEGARACLENYMSGDGASV